MSSHTHRPCPLVSHCPKAQAAPPSLELLSRREWVKRFVLGSATAIGSDWTGTLLADISPGAYSGNVLTFKLSDYPALQNDYGSMRFSLFEEGGATNDSIIIINRAPGSVFYAVSARCTHQQQTVDAFLKDDEQPGHGSMICYGHGSTYDIQGRVTHRAEENQPQADLPTYQTSFANGFLKVEIPSLNLRVNQVTLASVTGNTKRLRLSFKGRRYGIYRLYYTPSITNTPSQANFSDTESGPANRSFIRASTNGDYTMWVNSAAKRGFYFISLDVTPY